MKIMVSKRLNKAIDLMSDIPNDHGRFIAVAKLFGETPQAIRMWLVPDKDTGKVSMPNVVKLPDICDKLNINIEWLLTGKGDMSQRDDDDVGELHIDVDVLSKAMKYATKELKAMDFVGLPPKSQAKVITLLYEAILIDDTISADFKKILKMHIKML